MHTSRAARTALLHRIIGRHLKERGRRFGTLNVGQLKRRVAHTRIAALDQHRLLQIGRVPFLHCDYDRLLVADFTRGNRSSGARALRAYTTYRLSTQRSGRSFFLPFGRERAAMSSLRICPTRARRMIMNAHLVRNFTIDVQHVPRTGNRIIDERHLWRWLTRCGPRANRRQRHVTPGSALAVACKTARRRSLNLIAIGQGLSRLR